MFAETVIACLALGALFGFAVNEILRARPYERRSFTDRTRFMQAQADLHQYRAAGGGWHRGTPYIKQPDGLPVDVAEALVGNDDWSKRHDRRDVLVSLPRPRVTA